MTPIAGALALAAAATASNGGISPVEPVSPNGQRIADAYWVILGVTGDFDVYVNGVPQVEGRDFRRNGRSLVFDRSLAKEGRLGPIRWLSMLLGVAGTYRQNDSVDLAYESDGKRLVAANLPIQRG